jgi:hypothetical protein
MGNDRENTFPWLIPLLLHRSPTERYIEQLVEAGRGPLCCW